jgi:hypothetical protein
MSIATDESGQLAVVAGSSSDGETTTGPLTPLERYQVLDARVRSGVKTVVDVAEALWEIREGRLHTQANFSTFEDYVQSIGINIHTARKLLTVRSSQESIRKTPGGEELDTLPSSAKHVAAINKAPAELRPAVIQEAAKVAKQEKRSPTTRDYEAAVKRVVPVPHTVIEGEPTPPVVQGKVARKDARQPEEYLDERGFPVPRELWPVWRAIPDFLKVADNIRSCGISEEVSALRELGRKHGAPSIIKIAKEIERLHREIVELALDAKPAIVEGETWLCRGEMDDE